MKKLLLIFIVFVTSLSYCQTAEEYFNRGMSKDSLKDRRGAIDDYTKAIELNPNYSEAYFNRGLSKASLANRIKFTTNDNCTYYDSALEKTNLEDRRGAIDDYTKAIELNPNYSEAYYNRGFSKNELKDKKGARLDWAKAKELKK